MQFFMLRKSIVIILLISLFITGCTGAGTPPVQKSEPTVTLIPSVTNTFTPPPTATNIQPSTPTPISNAVYYVIVLDASEKMKEPFAGGTKWDAARGAAEAIVKGLEPGAKYSLVVIGGSSPTEGLDPCNEPSVALSTFSSQKKIGDQIAQLQPAGVGSIQAAYALAQKQLEGLPRYAIGALIFITSSSDACDRRDEWADLEKQFDFNADAGIDFYSEIVVLDETVNAAVQSLAIRAGNISGNINFQFPQNDEMLREANNAVLANLADYVNTTVATRPTESPLVSSFTLTPRTVTPTYTPSITPTPSLTYTPTITLTPSVTPTETITTTPSITNTPVTPTITSTWTPSATPSVTFTASPPFVRLLSVNYLSRGVGCQIDVRVQVTGSPANGNFHVRNAGMDAEGIASPPMTLQVGSDWISSFNINYLLTLPGDEEQYYMHEIWFEYNGVESNRLKELICPGLFIPQ